MHHSRDFVRRAVDSALQNGAKGRAAEWQAHAALREAEFGNVIQAKRQAVVALRMTSGTDVQALAALALARAGDVTRARTIAQDLSQRFPNDIWLDSYWLPSIRAAIEIERKNPARAIQALEISRPYELGGDPISSTPCIPSIFAVKLISCRRTGEQQSPSSRRSLTTVAEWPMARLARLLIFSWEGLTRCHLTRLKLERPTRTS